MDILIGVLIGLWISTSLSTIIGFIGVFFTLNNKKKLNFFTKLSLYSLITAFVSLFSLIYIHA